MSQHLIISCRRNSGLLLLLLLQKAAEVFALVHGFLRFEERIFNLLNDGEGFIRRDATNFDQKLLD